MVPTLHTQVSTADEPFGLDREDYVGVVRADAGCASPRETPTYSPNCR